MGIILQICAGGFYLLNKIFFCFSERQNTEQSQKWQKAAWIVYLMGLPAWVMIFINERNWMAAAVEAGGAFSMILGLYIVFKGAKATPKWLDHIALFSAIFGISYSLYDFGGITTLNQLLELGVVIGFLWGTYLIAKNRKMVGYSFFLLMNLSNASLMYIQDYHWLAAQQLISFCFILDAIVNRYKKTIKLQIKES